MRLLTSASLAYADVAALTLPGKVEYCRRHGYAHLDVALPADYRLARVQTWLECAAARVGGWTLFTGADVLLTNHAIRHEDLVDERFDLVISLDRFGINDDVFLMRGCTASVELVESILELMKANRGYSDQDAMARCLPSIEALTWSLPNVGWAPTGKPGKCRVKYVAQRALNSYLYHLYDHDGMVPDPQDGFRAKPGTWQPGDFALHLPGLSNKQRLPVLREYLTRIAT